MGGRVPPPRPPPIDARDYTTVLRNSTLEDALSNAKLAASRRQQIHHHISMHRIGQHFQITPYSLKVAYATTSRSNKLWRITRGWTSPGGVVLVCLDERDILVCGTWVLFNVVVASVQSVVPIQQRLLEDREPL